MDRLSSINTRIGEFDVSRQAFVLYSVSFYDIIEKMVMGAYVMEIQSYSFRSALSGFHRGDVISFLEKLSASHEAELR